MDEFLVQEHEDAQELANSPFGATLLHHVGASNSSLFSKTCNTCSVLLDDTVSNKLAG